MIKTIFICDMCHKEERVGEQAENWLSVVPPSETRFTYNSIAPWFGNVYGLYCSIACLSKRIEQKAKEDRGEYESCKSCKHNPCAGYLSVPSDAPCIAIDITEVAKYRDNAFKEIEDKQQK